MRKQHHRLLLLLLVALKGISFTLAFSLVKAPCLARLTKHTDGTRAPPASLSRNRSTRLQLSRQSVEQVTVFFGALAILQRRPLLNALTTQSSRVWAAFRGLSTMQILSSGFLLTTVCAAIIRPLWKRNQSRRSEKGQGENSGVPGQLDHGRELEEY